MIKVKVVFFASFKEQLDCSELALELNPDSTIQEVCSLLSGKGPRGKELFSDAQKIGRASCRERVSAPV